MLQINTGERTIESVLGEHGCYASTIRGVSMRPLLKTDRDVVVLNRVEGAGLSKYDVALYKVGERYVLHRIIDIDESRGLYIIRGDNTYSLEYVKYDQVLAVLVSFNRRGKHHSVSERGYRFYSVLWHHIYPLRYVFHLARCAASRVKRAIIKK